MLIRTGRRSAPTRFLVARKKKSNTILNGGKTGLHSILKKVYTERPAFLFRKRTKYAMRVLRSVA